MTRLTPLHLIPALIAAAAHAGEITVELRPFFVEKSFVATVMPGMDSVLLKLDAKSVPKLEIAEIAAHGSRVNEGDILVRFETKEFDLKLEDARNGLAASTVSLAQAEAEYAHHLVTSEHKLTAIRRAAEKAKEENTYFTETGRTATEDTIKMSIKEGEQMLANAREELQQLSKMYEADDVTEDTEKIVLVRQQNAVVAAEFTLRMEVLEQNRRLTVGLPREAESLANGERDTALALKNAEFEFPRASELKKLALATQKTANSRLKLDLADLEADRTLVESKAPAAGWFYHGPIENGRWTPGDFAKMLVPHGEVPAHRAFATFVPANAKLGLVAFLDEASAQALKVDLPGTASLTGHEELEMPVTLRKIAVVPGADGAYRTDLTTTWPTGITPVTGGTARVSVIAYQQPAAIAIPTKAIQMGAKGETVRVKLADGKTELREVKRGHATKEETEILSGLEVGQVVIIP
jgi:HlyD family secretion protein